MHETVHVSLLERRHVYHRKPDFYESLSEMVSVMKILNTLVDSEQFKQNMLLNCCLTYVFLVYLYRNFDVFHLQGVGYIKL